ncbi:MAG: B12-binding domain-containing radical SAM protein [Candidatus Omnitrophica bacterium]|nr:B12-binding domain-containing radical SAM protein [Candidatus Omnitrophota bacterium]
MLVDLIRVPDPTCIDDLLDEPLGLLYLAAVLQAEGHQVRITNLAGYSSEDWKSEIKEADVYGIQLYTPTAHHGITIARYIKQRFPHKLIIGGGAHPSAVPDAKDLIVFDHIVVGEGERSLIAILNAHKNKKNIPRIVKDDFIEDLDSLPFPARHLVDMHRFHRKVGGKRCFGIIGSRGCCFQCAFCDHALFGDNVRFRSIKNIVDEIQHIIEVYNVHHFEFFDDMWTISKKRLREFYEQVKDFQITYRCNGRTDILDPEVYTLLYESGCRLICYGIESGSQRILDAMKKETTVEKNLHAIKMAHDANIPAAGYFLLGFPGETRKTIQETMEFIKRSDLDQTQFYTFVPLPGCEVFKYPQRFNARIISHDFSDYFLVTGTDGCGGRTIETDALSAEELSQEMKKIRQFLKERGSKGGMQDYYYEKLKYKEK